MPDFAIQTAKDPFQPGKKLIVLAYLARHDVGRIKHVVWVIVSERIVSLVL